MFRRVKMHDDLGLRPCVNSILRRAVFVVGDDGVMDTPTRSETRRERLIAFENARHHPRRRRPTFR